MNQIVKVCFFFVLIFILPSCDLIKELAGISEPEKSDIKNIFTEDPLRECVALQTRGLKAKEVVGIICAGHALSNIDGLEQFPNLRVLILNTNSLSRIDLSPFPNLEYLDLSTNRFSEIDISHNPKLLEFFADRNSLDELDTSKNPLLKSLVLSKNDLSTLDLNNNPNLEELSLDENKFVGDMSLGFLDLSANTKLINLNLFDNDITNIDVSNNKKLNIIDLRKNDLISFDAQHNSNVSILRLNDNKITSLDLRANVNLDVILAQNNLIEEIYLPFNSKLRFAYLKGNNISCGKVVCNLGDKFEIPRNSSFIHLDLSSNNLEQDYLDIYQNPNFTELILSDNPNLSGVFNLENATGMVELRLDDTNITELNFGGSVDTALEVFTFFDFQVITAIGTPIDEATQGLLDDMEQQKINHPRYSDSESLFYIYELD